MSTTKPKLTQKMSMHLNGGSKFSQLNYRIYADGEPTEVFLIERTDGSPHYHYTGRELVCGEETLDLMKLTAGVNPVDWILERIRKTDGAT